MNPGLAPTRTLTLKRCGGFFTPTINIMDRAAGQGEFSALAKVGSPLGSWVDESSGALVRVSK